MIKIINYRQVHDVDNQEIGILIYGTCLSTDEKPLEYAGGSILIETDHNEGFWVWMFDEASKKWILQSSWGGSIKECNCPPVVEIIAQTLAALPIATREQLGILQIGDYGFNIKDGILSLNYDLLDKKYKHDITDDDKQEIIQELKQYVDNTVQNNIENYVNKVIENIIDEDEIVNKVLAQLPIASKTQKGIMQIGTGLSDGGDGLVNLDDTYTNKLINNGINTYVSNNFDTFKQNIAKYTIDSIPKATDSTYGLVKIGDNITVNEGVISIPDASDTQKGVVQIGDNITVNNGTISVPVAGNTKLGVVKAGKNITIDTDGTLNNTYEYTLPLMTTTLRGGAKLRDGTTEGDVQLSSTEGMYVDLTAINDKITELEAKASS